VLEIGGAVLGSEMKATEEDFTDVRKMYRELHE
jgi:hypothetical protein